MIPVRAKRREARREKNDNSDEENTLPPMNIATAAVAVVLTERSTNRCTGDHTEMYRKEEKY